MLSALFSDLIHQHKKQKTSCLTLFVLCTTLFSPLVANALPAFARQTGQNCVSCHAGGQFPELTPYGRLFKLTGYTIGTRTIPLSVMGVASLTKSLHPATDPSVADKEGNFIFQTGSVFLAGKVTDNIGLFAQGTYDNYGGSSGDQGVWSSDNFDLRYADRFISPTNDLIIGLTLNNNPTVTDVWNSAPAWIIYAPTHFGVTGPDFGPIASGLGSQVAGITAYAFWNQMLYAEVGAYKTANGFFSFLSKGINNADQTQLSGTNPYARIALSHEWGAHNAMIGLFGLNVNELNPADPGGPKVQFRDRGIDAQYQYLLHPHTVSAQFSYIKETIDNGIATGVATNDSNTLNSLRIKGTYIYDAKYGASLSFFTTTGSADSTLYSSSATFSPNTRGWTPEIFWTPVQNIRIGLQYYAYQKFDGDSSNYDGNGRNAKDNNTAFLYVWGAY